MKYNTIHYGYHKTQKFVLVSSNAYMLSVVGIQILFLCLLAPDLESLSVSPPKPRSKTIPRKQS